ncbi:hypothetical protein F7725_021075 [Dissostichus mawsoni]|uniref:RAS p21 protein activator 2 n=1 Tax=Dissostichus mawsoni TaxID=36200 RepID=A0A7J5YHR6_DISMA|nr:hypothetical protein F7725_021075 [Dissostichus mawsoni]
MPLCQITVKIGNEAIICRQIKGSKLFPRKKRRIRELGEEESSSQCLPTRETSESPRLRLRQEVASAKAHTKTYEDPNDCDTADMLWRPYYSYKSKKKTKKLRFKCRKALFHGYPETSVDRTAASEAHIEKSSWLIEESTSGGSGEVKRSLNKNSSPRATYICDICDSSFITETGLRAHVIGSHPCFCRTCGKQGPPGEAPAGGDYICSSCMENGSCFDNTSRSPNPEKKYRCSFCPQRFLYLATKRSHEKKHKETNEEGYNSDNFTPEETKKDIKIENSGNQGDAEIKSERVDEEYLSIDKMNHKIEDTTGDLVSLPTYQDMSYSKIKSPLSPCIGTVFSLTSSRVKNKMPKKRINPQQSMHLISKKPICDRDSDGNKDILMGQKTTSHNDLDHSYKLLRRDDSETQGSHISIHKPEKWTGKLNIPPHVLKQQCVRDGDAAVGLALLRSACFINGYERAAPERQSTLTMAEEDDATVRILQSLRGKICEAKNLGPLSGPNRQRDLCTFCTISLDQEEVFRTKVFDKSVSPFYGEDFYFEIPRPFQCLSFYVYAKSVFQRDLPVGKVSIRKDDLAKYSGKEHWCSLHPVDPNSEVQGKVHLEMRLNEVITENGSVGQHLVVRIIECQGLPLISGQNCDPYATVSLVGPARSDQKKTKVKKKTSNPHFEETFFFEVTRTSSYSKKSHFQVEEEDIEKLEIKVDLWNNENLAQDVFLGETRVHVKILRNDHIHKAWYLLQPKGNGSKSKSDDLGSLRLKLTYIEDTVLPSAFYTPLCNLLLKSPDVKPISASAAHILGDICRERHEAVLPTVRLLLHHNRFVPFVSAVAALELENTQEANTIFRGNSLATRCIDDMMKIICESNKTCEIDPENLQGYVQKVFSSITQSSSSCPPLMSDPHVQYSAVSSFVFLRFFAVAVLSPHSFQLRSHHPDPEISRTLTLISKTIQTLGSWGSLSKKCFKETYMYDFFKSFQEDKCIEKVKRYI